MNSSATTSSSRLRLSILLIVVGCLFVALFARLWYLQVINVSVASQQIQTNGTRTILTPAPRGEILDSEGQPLVDNISIPVIEVQQEDASDATMVGRLGALLGMSLKSLKAAINNDQYTEYDYVPVYYNASATQILYVEENASLFPGVLAATVSEPHVTALGQYAANIVGYVGPINSTQLKALGKDGYQAGDMIGQTGAEEEFENELRGKAGVTRIQVTATGQELSVVSSTPPVPGHNVRLTINGPLQKLAVQTLRTQEANARKVHDTVTKINFESPNGAVVVEDPRNGQILALATDPDYNPNLFNDGGISAANYERITTNPNGNETFDQATQGAYAPGSTFKLVTATAGLKTGLTTATKPFNDTAGYIVIGGTRFNDDNDQGSGIVDLAQAITVSSDNYFNAIGADLWDQRGTYGEDALQNVASGYGFNRPTGIDLPGESTGVIPTPQLVAAEHRQYPNAYPNGAWYTGVSAHMAIGQSLTVTPLQLANAYAAFANGGTLYKPQVALDAQNASGKTIKRYPDRVSGHTPALTAAERSAMIQGFVGVVNNLPGEAGTANVIFAGTPLINDDIAGKTGTAQVSGNQKLPNGATVPEQNTSVFTSFAPASDPRYVVDCFMPDAGYGADGAAPVVRTIYEKLFGAPITPVTYLNPGATTGSQN